MRIDFKSILEEKDKTGSPVFVYRVTLEGVEGCEGKGYSKKESQQLASKLTLEKLRREPQFIDLVFAAKTTKMEEEPVENVPSTEQPDDFIVVSSGMEGEGFSNEDGEAGGSSSSRETSGSSETSSSRETSSPSKPSSSKDSKAKRNRRSPMYRKDEAASEALDTASAKTAAPAKTEAASVSSGLTPADLDLSDEDFDLSHISAREQSREEIIAAAEAAAFGEE